MISKSQKSPLKMMIEIRKIVLKKRLRIMKLDNLKEKLWLKVKQVKKLLLVIKLHKLIVIWRVQPVHIKLLLSF